MMILVMSRTEQVEFRVALSQLCLEMWRGDIVHRTSRLPLPLPTGLHYDTGTPGDRFFEQMVGAVQPDSSYSTYDLRFESDRGLGEEPDRVRSLHIGGEEDERAYDSGDGDGDDDDDGKDVGDEEQPVSLAPVAPASGSDGRPRHGKGKGFTDSFMSVMSKISGSRNKRPDTARDVLAPTQRKRVKASDWEQRGPAEWAFGSPDMAWTGTYLYPPVYMFNFFINFFYVISQLFISYVKFFYDLLRNANKKLICFIVTIVVY
ncbi:hypothetical protein M9H77_28122 [Catharanthus roseus]|uniref:Uncharacterized protein n=1 Tax=Catharanthus roseus TaxID=4058 RepID=A0ACC0AFD3_CATRO|nr:hypothetical protein M9H77_28122 [Catharanthus roseus]